MSQNRVDVENKTIVDLWSKRLKASLYILVVVLANDVIFKHPVSDRTQNDQIVKNLVIFGSSRPVHCSCIPMCTVWALHLLVVINLVKLWHVSGLGTSTIY